MKQCRILIVDDQPGIRKLLCELFQEYIVEEAQNGIEALVKVEKQQPDLILLDMKMPGINGLETLRLLREINPEIPVIMMTAFESEVVLPANCNLGPTYSIQKPFDLIEIKTLVEKTIKNRNNMYICPK